MNYVLSIAHYPKRIVEAKRLISLADQNPGETIFSALASLLSAVALEDAIRSKIVERCQNASAAGISGHAYGTLLEKSVSIRQRMTVLAEIVGQQFFSAKDRSVEAASLHKLVTLRNDLVHVDDHVYTLNEDNNSVSVLNDTVTITLDIPDLWVQVSKESAVKFGNAVDLYVKEVIDPLSDMMKYWEPNNSWGSLPLAPRGQYL